MTITEFLLARIGEDEQVANSAAAVSRRPLWTEDNIVRHIARWDPARVLAECEAKRRIVARLLHYEDRLVPGSPEIQAVAVMVAALRMDVSDLANVYADHPEYQQEWE